jgi:hypothetical protein
MYQYYSVVLSIVHVLLVTNFVGTLLHCIFVVFLPVILVIFPCLDVYTGYRVGTYSGHTQIGTKRVELHNSACMKPFSTTDSAIERP